LSRKKGVLDTHAPSHMLFLGILIVGWQGMGADFSCCMAKDAQMSLRN
jgi:hypothetical protein